MPENELIKAFKLFIYLFKAGYYRRYMVEKGDSNKWWYWDLTNEENLEKIRFNLRKQVKSPFTGAFII